VVFLSFIVVVFHPHHHPLCKQGLAVVLGCSLSSCPWAVSGGGRGVAVGAYLVWVMLLPSHQLPSSFSWPSAHRSCGWCCHMWVSCRHGHGHGPVSVPVPSLCCCHCPGLPNCHCHWSSPVPPHKQWLVAAVGGAVFAWVSWVSCSWLLYSAHCELVVFIVK